MSHSPAARPRPHLTPDNRPFWDAAGQGRFVLPWCAACARHFFPIAPVCPSCLSEAIEWRAAPGHGQVTAWVVYHRAFFPCFADRLPYVVVQVALAAGPRLNGNLLDADLAQLRGGLPVEIAFERVDDTLALPQFRIRRHPA